MCCGNISDISESKMVTVFHKLYMDNVNHVPIDFVKHLKQYLLAALKTIEKSKNMLSMYYIMPKKMHVL